MVIDGDKFLEDGIYDITGIFYIESTEDLKDPDVDIPIEVEEFMQANKDYVIGCAYGCYTAFIFASCPPLFKGTHVGTGFNYGSTNILSDCPKSILILAEDD